MGTCDMCGKEGLVIPTLIEGTEMNACKACGKFGRTLRKPTSRPQRAAKVEVVQTIVSDFPEKIRAAREAKGMTQKEFANMLKEKESVIQKLETHSLNPSISLARKLERALKIRLVEEEQSEPVEVKAKSTGPLTIGDLLKVKK